MDIGEKTYSIPLKRGWKIDDIDSVLLKDWRARIAIRTKIVDSKAGSDTGGAKKSVS
jgi:hypothetical protein